MGYSSLTRDQTQAPCIGNAESWPLDYQGSPHVLLFSKYKVYPLFSKVHQLDGRKIEAGRVRTGGSRGRPHG